jgi:hypothetical protein
VFRAHRGVNKHRPLMHRGKRVASIKAHSKRALHQRKVKGVRYGKKTVTKAPKKTPYKSLYRTPSAYRQTKPKRYKAVKF